MEPYFSPLGKTAIEWAFNTGITAEVPAIPGLSPTEHLHILDLGTTIANIRANPTEAEAAEIARLEDDPDGLATYLRTRAFELTQESGYTQQGDEWVKKVGQTWV